jgi:hypothetical protein
MITPPMVGKKGYGYSILNVGDFSETVIVRLVIWNVADYLNFWINECIAILDGMRNKGVLPTAVYRTKNGQFSMGERFLLWKVDDKIVVRSYALNKLVENINVDEWWKTTPDYHQGDDVFEISAPLADVENWVAANMNMLEIQKNISIDKDIDYWRMDNENISSYNESVFTDGCYLYTRDLFSAQGAWVRLALDGMRIELLDRDLNRIGD